MADKKKKFTYIPREDKRTNPEVRLDNTFPPTLISSPNQSIEELISLYNQGFLTSDDTEEGTYSMQGFPVRSLLQNESISTPTVFPEDRAPAPMHTLPYRIEDIRQVGHVPEVQALLRSVEHQPRQEVARTQRWSDHHDRTSGVSAEARQADAEQARDRYPYTSFGNPVEDFKGFQDRATKQGYKIVYGTTPKKGKASFVRHNEKTIYFDPFLAREKYREKAWKFPKLPGVKPLEDRHFPTERSWFDFLHEHELAHLKLKRKKNESTADYENRINKYVLDFLEAAKGADDFYRWDNIEGALRTVMGAGPRLLGGLGMALWPTSTVSQKEEDRKLRMHRGD